MGAIVTATVAPISLKGGDCMSQTAMSEVLTREMNYIGLWRRLLAFMIDIIPIVFSLSLIAYLFLGFDEVAHNYFRNGRDLEARAEFLFQRNLIRDSSLVVWIMYCTVMESSGMRATIGKRLVGAVVVTEAGAPLRFRQALIRNVSKIISIIPLFIGFLWAAFSKGRQAWHDKIAKTYVVQIYDPTIKARDQSPGPASGF
jgi:uncharacterized RDD family membrane protein YckC